MSQSAPDLQSSRQLFRRYGILVGAAVAASLLAGVVTAAFSPAMVTSTALVALPVTTLTTTTAVAIADSDPVLVGALPRLSPGTSLATVHGEVQVRSLTPYVLSVSARADPAAQAEATANAVAESYIGYAGAAGSPAGHVPAVMLQPAMSASGAAGLMRLLVGVMLGVASGVLTGVIAALANRRLTQQAAQQPPLALRSLRTQRFRHALGLMPRPCRLRRLDGPPSRPRHGHASK
jgi:hypothetical protein